MTDIPDWEKQYWAQKQQQKQQQAPRKVVRPEDLPHFEPAHITQNKHQGDNPNGQWQDIDPVTAMYTNAQGRGSHGAPGGVNTVFLREGAVIYRAVQAGSFGSTIPLVRNCGPTQDTSGKEFEMRGERACYVIDDLNVVDMSNLDSKRAVQLIELRATWIGTVLVEKSFVISTPLARPQILKG